MAIAPWEIDETDVSELRAFADTEIAAGRFLQGAKLRALLDSWETSRDVDHYKMLLERDKQDALELKEKLQGLKQKLEALNGKAKIDYVKLEPLINDDLKSCIKDANLLATSLDDL